MYLATHDGQLAPGQGAGPVELVRGEDDGCSAGGGRPDKVVNEVAPAGIQAGVGLVEQPQLWPTGHQDGQRGPTALAGGEEADGDLAQALIESEAAERRTDFRRWGAGGSHRES